MATFSFALVLEGLIALVDRAAESEAYLLPGHDDHMASLVIRGDFLDVENTSWTPTTIGLIQEQDTTGAWVPRQVGVWSLHGEDVRVVDAGAAGKPAWANQERMFRFGVEHPNSTTLSKQDIIDRNARVGIVTLVGSQSLLQPSMPTANDNFSITKGGVTKTQALSRFVHWTPGQNTLPTITNTLGDEIRFNTSAGSLNAWACVSNVAPVPTGEGLAHFHHYYDGVTLAPGDQQIELGQLLFPIWDCSPPVAWA